MGSRKIVPRAIVEWVNGLDHAPTVAAVADTLEEAERVEAILKKSFEKESKLERKCGGGDAG